MKPFVLVLPLALFLGACATPEQKHVDFQAQLNEQARVNFERERNEHRAARGLPPLPSAEERARMEREQARQQNAVNLNPFASRQAPAPQPKPAPVKPKAVAAASLVAVQPKAKAKVQPPKPKATPVVIAQQQRHPIKPALQPKPAPKPVAMAKPQPPRQKTRPADDTIYEPDQAALARQRGLLHQSKVDYRTFEAQEARRLGKTPAQLSKQERASIRARYQAL